MTDINQLHEEIFQLLSNWSEEERTSMDLTRTAGKKQINPYFYMRSVRDERFRNGYWFPGNDSYLCISFWSGGDSLNKTPNIYFEINEKHGCRIIISAKDSEAKSEYFSNMLETMHVDGRFPFSQGKNHKVWIKHLDSPVENWRNELFQFIINEKRMIDSFVADNEFIEMEEFVSGFGMISASDFEKMFSRVQIGRQSLIEARLASNNFLRTKSFLPLAIDSVSVENFQGIKIASVTELRKEARWIFITGENGYGKTTLLQSIALGLTKGSATDIYLEGHSRIAIEYFNDGHKYFCTRTKKEFIGDAVPVIGYGPARLNIKSLSSENREEKTSGPVTSLFDNEAVLKNIGYELFATNYSDSAAFSELEMLIKTATNGRIDSIKVIRREVLFLEKLTNGDILDPLPLAKLAAGFRSIINLVTDIYLRLREYHVGRPFSEYYGIVLIDEIENHLHPVLQRELPIALSNVFPKIQFIVSTHSPIPLLAAEKNSVILTINRNKGDGVSIERLDETIDFPNLLPNAILTSPIFGFDNIIPESKDNSDFIRSENTYGDVIFNDEQKRRIDSHLSDETTDAIMKMLKKN